MLALKEYQKGALESLRLYLRACEETRDADEAFYQTTRKLWNRGVPYRPLAEPSELAGVPYVCLRLPTGGGKTLLACHSVSVVCQNYLERERHVVLWLVPSKAILEQTRLALSDRCHPYRQALAATLGEVTVLDLAGALEITPPMLAGSTVVIVATLQAFRVEDTMGRKVYENDGALMDHFAGLSPGARAALETDV